MKSLYIVGITEDVVFYNVSLQHIEQFQQLVMRTSFPSLSVAPAIQCVNPFITACNIWFALHAHHEHPYKKFYLDERRRMAYDAAFFQLEYIERHRAIRSFLRQHNDEQAMIVLAYTLSIHCMNWILSIMKAAEKLDAVTYYLEEEHFKNAMRHETTPTHQAMQKAYMQTIICNIQQEDGLNLAILQAIRDAHSFLKHIQIS